MTFRLFLVLLTFPLVTGQSCTYGVHGVPGIPGVDGEDGHDGQKGETGSPGIFEGWNINDYIGSPGMAGNPGKVGPKGPTGEKGYQGPPGHKGITGESGDYRKTLLSAFSALRQSVAPVRSNQLVRFDKLAANAGTDFDVRVSKFQCQTPGIYYFTYHASSRGNLCLNIIKGKAKVVGFCDHVVNAFQVTTGGVVLQLKKDETVWLQTTDKFSLLGTDGADSVFSGFLLFPDSS
uniref:Complement C1q B chain n=1 Tax=Leptobrachium leishanense TaxID=445787 RepID=A0A8C5MUZ4_9ANUR